MARSILAVVVAYVVMFILAFIAFATAFLALDPGIIFKPGIYEASITWIGIAFVIQFVIAIIGGFVCAAIANGGRTPFALAILAIVLGIGVALADMNKAKAKAGLVRNSDTPRLEAVQKAYWPVAVPFAFPFASAVGIVIGGKLRRRH